MKKIILLFTFLFTLSSSFISCRDNAEGADEVLEDENEVFEDEVAVNDWGGEYDLNDDGLWDSDEYGEAYEEDWTSWDANSDGFLDDSEFYNTSYSWVDANDDELIDENEWNEGYNNLYGDYGAMEDFGEYDLNDDNFLDTDEWFEGWGDSDWFNDYDVNDDELVDNDEWDDGLFGLWDDDNDGFWDEDEYNTYTTYYDTW